MPNKMSIFILSMYTVAFELNNDLAKFIWSEHIS